jgi:hypothetical protein
MIDSIPNVGAAKNMIYGSRMKRANSTMVNFMRKMGKLQQFAPKNQLNDSIDNSKKSYTYLHNNNNFPNQFSKFRNIKNSENGNNQQISE